MKADQIFEDAKQVICIYPGRFQPPHRGHASTYRQLEKKYGAQNTFIATSNKTDADKSPFNFAEKKALLIAAGVPAEQIVQVVNTYAANEITSRFDLSKTIVLYAVGEKDMGEDPRFGSFVKKDGSPAYLQKMTDNPETADKHAYLIVAPTVQFQINGQNITSASEIRQMYRQADPAERSDIVHQLYGMNTKTATQIFNKLLPQAQPAESIEENFKDGRNPHDKGDSARHGIPKHASISSLRKIAKQGGRKGQLAHWQANMRSGKKKASEAKLLDKPTPTVEELAKKYNVKVNVVNVQLAKGIKIEAEHTDHEQVAREIALDHLSERLDYYIRLEKVENESYGATNPTSQLGDRAVAVMPFDRFAVKMDENWEPNLFEVSMSPGALNDFAKSEVAQTMTIGFEMELAIPDLPEGNGSYGSESEAEDDMEYNDDFPTGARWRGDVISWLEGGDNPNYDRDVERTMEWFDEQFFEYADGVFSDAVESDEDLQEEIKKEIHDILALQDKPSDADAIAAEYDEQTDIYADALSKVQEAWQENEIDSAFDDFRRQYRIRDMEDFLNYVNRNHPRISLHWPYQTFSGGDGEGGDLGDYLQDMANDLERQLKRVNSDFYVVVSDDYHDESREINKFIIEPDGSIAPQGREFISPPMQFADGIAAMEMMFAWAEGNGYRTNQSTGFHMGISLPNHETQNIDHMKFILMLGDAHVLEKFNRAKAHYAVNTVNTMRDNLKNGRKVSKEDVAGYLRQMATGMQDLATTELNKLLVPRGEHRQSVNIKNKYMEIRSAGDNYLPRFSDIRLTLLRYLRTLEVSADSQAYRKEYAKKLSKFLTNTNMIRTVDPVTGRKGVASKDSLDATVQHAFDQYFTALQNGESGDAAIAMLTATLNKYKGDKQSQLKGQLKNKQANANPDSAKVKYLGSDRVEYSTRGNANDVINDIINYMREEGMGPMVQRATFLEAPKGQKLIQVKFRYTSSTGRNLRKSYWCFAPDILKAIAEAKKAWNTGADQPGDMWTASDYSDGESLNAVLYQYTDSDKTPPDDRLNGSLEQTRTRPVTAQDTLYSIRSHNDAGVRTFNAANDAEANQYARQFFAQNREYNTDNTVLWHYSENGIDREQVWWTPEQPARSTAEGTPGTFIITYLGPTGNEQQTAYDANSATEAATLFRLQHPASYQIHQITRLQESVSEAKTPKRPKTIIDGAMKTLINKGRSEDEAIADLKKEIDKKFYSEDQVTFARMQPGETIAEALARARSRLTKS